MDKKTKALVFDPDIVSECVYNPETEKVVVMGKGRFGWVPFVPDDVLKELVFGWENDEDYLDYELCNAIDNALSAELASRESTEAATPGEGCSPPKSPPGKPDTDPDG